MTTTIPCRAKNPDTCVYHGAQKRAEAALLRGDGDTWLRETETMLRNSDLAEVQDFIAEQAKANSTTTPVPPHQANLELAKETFPPRLASLISQLNDGADEVTYTVGGTRADLAGTTVNKYRDAYQQIAHDIIEFSTSETYADRYDPDTYQYDARKTLGRILDHTRDAYHRDDKYAAEAYEQAYTIIETIPADDGIGKTRDALKRLDTAYWEEAGLKPVPAEPEIPYEERFTRAYLNHDEKFNLYGVTRGTHNLTPYQVGLTEAFATLNARTRETDAPDGNTYVLTDISDADDSAYNLVRYFGDMADNAYNQDTARAYRDVGGVLRSSLRVYQQPGKLDTYGLFQNIENLFQESINQNR